jgi:hypothetical protein
VILGLCRPTLESMAVEIAPAGSPRAGGPVEWFRAHSSARNAYLLLGFVAAGYSLGVALPLAVAGAMPMPDPYLRIANADYFMWGTFFYGPVIVTAWLLAAGVMYIVAAALHSAPDFRDLLRLSAFATGIGTLGTLLPDLVTSPLRAMGIIDEQAWELSVAGHGAWFVFLWFWMAVYLALFLTAYPIAVRLATRLDWPPALLTGVVGYAVFQGFEYVFIR